MSYILDSLKKSDQERKRGSVPGVLSDHGGSGKGPGGPRGPRPSFLLGGGALILVLLVLVIWQKPWRAPAPEPTAPAATAPKKPMKAAAAPPAKPFLQGQKPPTLQHIPSPINGGFLRPPVPPAGASNQGRPVPPGADGPVPSPPSGLPMNRPGVVTPPTGIGGPMARPGMAGPGGNGSLPAGAIPPPPGIGAVVNRPGMASPNGSGPVPGSMAAQPGQPGNPMGRPAMAGVPIPPPPLPTAAPAERVVGGRHAGAPNGPVPHGPEAAAPGP
ncbi:MAG: hypothetical protein M0017_04015, partial [Desulfobacteraceae bacterium]|nr:hypothetical protein [Desulfobacteraceae bacterium]